MARVVGARHKMTAKRRTQLKRAQAISARKRRLAPNKRQPVAVRRARARKPVAINTVKVHKRGISKRHVAGGIAAAAVIAGGAYGIKRHQNISRYKKERRLIRKHRSGYLPPTLTFYHQTYRQGHRAILAGDDFKHKQRHHNRQRTDRVWGYTRNSTRERMSWNYGEYTVKTSVKRSHIADFAPSFGAPQAWEGKKVIKGEGRGAWVSIKREHLGKYKFVDHYSPRANPVHGTSANRARARRISRAGWKLGVARFAVSGKGVASLIPRRSLGNSARFAVSRSGVVSHHG